MKPSVRFLSGLFAVLAAASAFADDPIDALYADNLLVNPGFEKGEFVKDRTKGWTAVIENGMEAKFESAVPNKPVQPFEGRKALRLFVKDPAKYSNKALTGSWDEFAHGANGGKGAPRAQIQQVVRVRPGAKYALRLRWRATGLYNVATPGLDRGVVTVTIRCDWLDAGFNYIKGTVMIPPKMLQTLHADSEEWTTLAYPDFSPNAKLSYPKASNVPFEPPQDAVYLRVYILFVCQRPKVKPEFWLDQVELAEIPDGANLAPGAAQPAPANAPAKPAASAQAAAVEDGGVLRLPVCGGAEFRPLLPLPEWKGMATLEKPDPAAEARPGVFAYRAGDVRIRGAASFQPMPDKSLRATWRFLPERDVELAHMGVAIHLPCDRFAGGSVRFDATDVELPAEPREKPPCFSGNASAVSVRGPDGKESFLIFFPKPARLFLQDDRFWKRGIFELRVLSPVSSPYPAGVEQDFSFSLRRPLTDGR